MSKKNEIDEELFEEKVETNENECHCECCGHESSCECENETRKAEEYKHLLQVVQADFDNFRKRSFGLVSEAKLEGEANVLMKVLPALDAFDKATEMISDENVLKGVQMIEKQLYEALKSLGVEKIDSVGEKFDTRYHNVIMIKNDNSLEDDVVTDICQAGYKKGDKILRYAQVIVNKKGE